MTILNRLLKHAPTLKVLELEAFGFPFPVQQLHQFPHLSNLELATLHELRAVSYLLPSYYRQLPDRIVPRPNIRHIHLQVGCYPLKVVLDTLKIQAGVQLRCDVVVCRHCLPVEQA